MGFFNLGNRSFTRHSIRTDYELSGGEDDVDIKKQEIRWKTEFNLARYQRLKVCIGIVCGGLGGSC